MCVKKEEVHFCTIILVSKTNRCHLFVIWLETILAQAGMRMKLSNLGIMRVVAQVRKMAVDKKLEDLEFLMLRWSTETHFFVTVWRGFDPKMEDMAILTSLPMFDEDRVTNFKITEGEDKERLNALTSFLSKSKCSTKKTTYLSWMKYFTEGSRLNNPYLLDAFLATG